MNCPNCGHPLHSTAAPANRALVAIIVLVFIFGLAALAYWQSDKHDRAMDNLRRENAKPIRRY